jgi:hypothetical protein
MRILFILVLVTLAFTVQGYGLGCAPSNNNQDCENPHTQTCTKILIGTTAKVKALGKYYYQCLPSEWATQAVQAAQAHVLDASPLEKVEEKVQEKVQEKVAEKVEQVVPVQNVPVAQVPTESIPTSEVDAEEKEEEILEEEETESLEDDE